MSLDSSRQLGQTVGAKLRAARLAKKYTQSQLAQPEFSISYISAIERGQIQPSLRALEILAKRLGINASDLLPGNGQVANNTLAVSEAALREEEQALLLLEAQISLSQKDPEQAIILLRALLTRKGNQDLALLVSTLLGQAYLQGGYLQESEQVLASIVEQAREAKDRLYPRILSLQSAVYAATHNLPRALQLQHESLAALKQAATHDSFFLAQVSSNLGEYYNRLEQLDQANTLFEQALRAVQTGNASEQRRQIYWNLMQEYKEREELQQVAFYSSKWLLADQLARFAALRSEIQHSLGHALVRSRPDEAYGYFLAEYQKADTRQNPLSRASVGVHLAAWLVARDRFEEAEPYAREAHTLASPFGETAIAAEALLLLGEIVYKRQEYQDGDQWFEAGLLLLEKRGEKEALAEHLTRYAQLLEARGLLPQAIIYWKRAYNYRQNHRQEFS
jgi:transcriptional regulator with XRE-family HTH domain